MKQEKLIIRRKRRQKYNSYKGEITPAVENVIDRDFHATKPEARNGLLISQSFLANARKSISFLR